MIEGMEILAEIVFVPAAFLSDIILRCIQ